jgi:hypothetical protein
MTDQIADLPALAAHGSMYLPSVEVDSYNLETRDEEGFLGDRVSKATFRNFIDTCESYYASGAKIPSAMNQQEI